MVVPALLGAAGLGGVAAWKRAERRGRRRIEWTPPGGSTHTATLAVRSLGETGPPVLLLHGLAGSSRYWGGAYDALAERTRLVVPDLLGFGRSPRPPVGYGPEDHVDALAASLADHGIDEPVVVVGHSLGSLLALALASRRPELVRAVVGISPPLFHGAAQASRYIARLGVTGRLFALPGPVAHLACNWMCAHRHAAGTLAHLLRPDLPAAIARDGAQHSWVSYSETMRRVVLGAPAPAYLPDIGCPVRLIAGGSDPIVDRVLLDEIATRHQNVTAEVWPGGGHDLPLTHPRACIAAIDTMVATTDAG